MGDFPGRRAPTFTPLAGALVNTQHTDPHIQLNFTEIVTSLLNIIIQNILSIQCIFSNRSFTHINTVIQFEFDSATQSQLIIVSYLFS